MIFLMVVETEEEKGKLEILFEQYWRLLYKVALEILRNHSDVEDVLQDTYEKVARNITHVGDPYGKEARNFLVVIAKNTAIDLYRKKKRIRRREVDMDELHSKQVPRVYIKTCADEEEKIVINAINSLPPKYRDVLSLKFTQNLSIKEISKILNISETNVKQRIFRAKIKLKEELQKRIR